MNLTLIFIFSVIGLVVAFDIYIIAKKGKSESVSAHIIRSGRKYPLVVLITGILLGHLFWSMKTEDIYKDIDCVKVEDAIN